MTRLDKLGRRIPEFDRSAANRKGAQTRKDKYGTDAHSRVGSLGARMRTRGYFGKLKDEGKDEELKKLSQKGIEARQGRRDNGDGGHSVPGDDSR